MRVMRAAAPNPVPQLWRVSMASGDLAAVLDQAGDCFIMFCYSVT